MDEDVCVWLLGFVEIYGVIVGKKRFLLNLSCENIVHMTRKFNMMS